MYYFCTYFDRNYLARGLALHQSLLRHCRRQFVLWVLCFDSETYDLLADLNLAGIRLISRDQFEANDDGLQKAKAGRTKVEYFWTCTPSLPLYVLNHHSEVDCIAYVDSDLYFFADPQALLDELNGCSIGIIEHRFAKEYEHMAEHSGIYNVGIVLFRRGIQAMECLEWWRERCLEWCYARAENGKYGDQKYLDDWPERFQGTIVLQQHGVGIAPWNIGKHIITRNKQGILIDDQALIYYHFHGYQKISDRLIQPVSHPYHVSAQQIALLYLPYARELYRAEGVIIKMQSRQPTVDIDLSLGNVVGEILSRRWLFVSPNRLSQFLWAIGVSNLANRERVKAGFAARVAGNLSAARRYLLAAALRNPLILRNRSIISLLAESWVGSDRMARYREWWRRGT
jgi:hypothetical protein